MCGPGSRVLQHCKRSASERKTAHLVSITPAFDNDDTKSGGAVVTMSQAMYMLLQLHGQDRTLTTVEGEEVTGTPIGA